MNKKALIAMSGGVDSSVSALMMLEQDYECTGVTMKLFANEDIGVSKANSCCSIDDVADARSVATSLGMLYYVFNFADRFERDVIDRFVDAYVNGRTPNPCIDCNRYLKFDQLFVRAQELGCDYVVTGHYAQISYDEAKGRYLLRKAVDPLKDQSYVLYSLTQEQLAHAMFLSEACIRHRYAKLPKSMASSTLKSMTVRISALSRPAPTLISSKHAWAGNSIPVTL